MVGWEATGCAMGAYENALKYCQERLQFGKPIGSFQMVQISSQELATSRFAVPLGPHDQLQAEGKMTDAHASLPKPSRQPSAARRCLGARAARRQRHLR